MTLTYGSVCSGYCAATLAWKPLGWTPEFFSEIEKFPSAVLAHHYGSNMPGEPLSKNGIPNHGDFTKIGRQEAGSGGAAAGTTANPGPVDLLVGGTPCQSFSVAGKRLGLDDPRGNLALEFLALARRLGARWIVWENVPGVLSSYSGSEHTERQIREGHVGGEADCPENRDFAMFLSFVRECGYGFAYRILDAQYVRVERYPFAVPQRRRRVFVIGYLGDWRRAAAVLFDRESLRGDPAPRREAGQGIAPTIASRPTGGGGLGTDFDLDGGLIASERDVSGTVSAKWAKGSGGPAGDEVQNIVAFPAEMSGTQCAAAENLSPALSVTHTVALALNWAVRRLTPTECERLQGVPDGFTRIPWRGKPAGDCPDGPRYKALGNSMAVNVMALIGERIDAVERLIGEGRI